MKREISFPPPSDSDDPELVPRHMRMLPWWRRFGAWLSDFHRFVLVVVSACGSTVVAHAWLKTIITKEELKGEVAAAVVVVMLSTRVDLETMKQRTGEDFPAWRQRIDARIAAAEKAAGEGVHLGEKANDRIDQYLHLVASRGR